MTNKEFKDIILQLQPYMQAVAEKLLKDADSASDAVQEAVIDESRLGEMAHHVAQNEGLDKAWAPLSEKDILDIFKACL